MRQLPHHQQETQSTAIIAASLSNQMDLMKFYALAFFSAGAFYFYFTFTILRRMSFLLGG